MEGEDSTAPSEPLGTMFVRNGAVTSGQSLLRDDQNLRNKCVTVQLRSAGRRASPYRYPG